MIEGLKLYYLCFSDVLLFIYEAQKSNNVRKMAIIRENELNAVLYHFELITCYLPSICREVKRRPMKLKMTNMVYKKDSRLLQSTQQNDTD